MFETTLPLAFGNVTVATLVIVLALTIVAILIEAAIFALKGVLNLDHPDAPTLNMKNPVMMLVEKLHITKHSTLKDIVFKHTDGYWYVWSRCSGKVLDRRYHSALEWRLEGAHKHYGQLQHKQEAMKLAKKYYKVENEDEVLETGEYLNKSLILKVMVSAVLFDVFFFMLSISFLPTIIISGVIALAVGVRWLSGKVWSGFAKSKSTTDNHEERIINLESNNQTGE